METYTAIMHSFSFFGFLNLIISLYLLLRVPTKLNLISRVAIHGHALLSSISQLYLTLGTVPTYLLPCPGGYPSGLLAYFNLMSSLNQSWTQICLIAVSAWFSSFISINRALSVLMNVTENTKKMVLKSFFVFLIIQSIVFVSSGFMMEDGVNENRLACKQMLRAEYHHALFMQQTVIMDSSKAHGMVYTAFSAFFILAVYVLVAFITTPILFLSLRRQSRLSQSSRYNEMQRKLTVGVVCLGFFKFLLMALPIFSLMFCFLFGVGIPIVSQICFLSLSLYSFFGSFAVLMSITDYRRKVFQAVGIVIPSSYPSPKPSNGIKIVMERVART